MMVARLRIVLVGGFGYVGRRLIRELTESQSVIVFSDPRGARRAAETQSKQAVIAEMGDIRDETSIREVMLMHCQEAVVSHLAALTAIRR
jgi:UDP-glucose 4-epimerase